MAKTTTREFRWDDPGAPSLTGEAGSFYALLKACLVGSGGVAYGSGANATTAAGWTLEWDDPENFTAVFRNSTAHGGSGCFLRVQDDASFSGGARVARIDVYESMSDIDTGTNLAEGGYVWKALTATGTARSWVLLADQRTVYGSTYVNGTPPSSVAQNWHTCAWGAGDYEPAVPGDPGVFCAATGNNAPGTAASEAVQSGLVRLPLYNGGTVTPNGAFCSSRSAALGAASTQIAVVPMLWAAANAARGVSGTVNAGGLLPYTTADRLFMLPALVCGGGSAAVLRGRLRGAFASMNALGGLAGFSVGAVVTPVLAGFPLSLATLRGSVGSSGSSGAELSGFLFVERAASWDDV